MDWNKLLKENKAWCYIKHTNKRYEDLEYYCFEVGYCTVNDGKIKDKLVLGECSDHIWLNNLGESPEDLNMDLLKDGYIRLFSHHNKLWWGTFDFVFSSMIIKKLT